MLPPPKCDFKSYIWACISEIRKNISFLKLVMFRSKWWICIFLIRKMFNYHIFFLYGNFVLIGVEMYILHCIKCKGLGSFAWSLEIGWIVLSLQTNLLTNTQYVLMHVYVVACLRGTFQHQIWEDNVYLTFLSFIWISDCDLSK